MCLMMYLGSIVELRLRNEEFISVEQLKDDQNAVRQFIEEPHVYFIGSHSGCSCDFPYVIADTHIDYYEGMFDDTKIDCDDDSASLLALFSIIDECLVLTGKCSFFPVGDGSESIHPKGQVNWLRAEISPETFVVTQHFLYNIYL